MSDAHGVARDQLRSFIERIERLEEEKKTIADDIKDVYGEAKGMGFDAKILKKVIAIRKMDRDERAEQEAILDTYLAALGMIEQPDFFAGESYDRSTGELSPKLAQTIVTGMQTEAGRAALVAAVDIMIDREEAEEQVPSSEQSEGNGSRGHQHVHSRQTDGAERGRQDGQAAAPDHEGEATSNGLPANSEMDRAMEGSFETGSVAAENARKAIPDVGLMPQDDGDVTHAGAGEIPATISKPTPSMDEMRIANALILRPNCKRPAQETCGGQGRNHCRDCMAVPVEREREDA
jgi:uncharacterized protein (UPF0335 family)